MGDGYANLRMTTLSLAAKENFIEYYMGRVRSIIRIDVTFNGDATEDTPVEVIGIALGMTEFLDGRQACYFDCQGWGFLELGRIW